MEGNEREREEIQKFKEIVPENYHVHDILLPQLNREEFQDIVHWGPELYHLLHKNKGKKEEEDEDDSENDEPSSSSKLPKEKKESTLSCYMEDKHGKPIPKPEWNSACLRAKLFWNGLKPPPVSGQKIHLKVQDEFVLLMEKNHPWLCYCENHWKTDRIWVNHYPNWYKTAIKGKLRANAAPGEVIDVDSVDVDVQAPQGTTLKQRVVHTETDDPQKRPRVEEDESAPPHHCPLTLRTRVCVFF